MREEGDKIPQCTSDGFHGLRSGTLWLRRSIWRKDPY